MKVETRDGVVFIPGLGGGVEQFWPAVWLWINVFGFEVGVFPVNWYGAEQLDAKLNRLASQVEDMKLYCKEVSIVGLSAGGCLAFNFYTQYPHLVYKAVSVGGRLRRGMIKGFRSFDSRTASSTSFRQSVIRFEDLNQGRLSQWHRERLMTTRAMLGDELVPSDTSYLEGAKNIFVPWGEHVMSNALAVTLFAYPLVKFLRQS